MNVNKDEILSNMILLITM